MSNGMNIQTKEDWVQMYHKDPDLALGLIFENLSDIKRNCSCRLQTCKKDMNAFRLKNVAVQAASGIMGGAAAVWVYVKLFFNNMNQ